MASENGIIVDEAGKMVENPDLERGYIDYRGSVVHHDAQPAQPAITQRKLLDEDPDDPDNKLYQSVTVKPAVPAQPAWDEPVTTAVYIPYTPEELAERERQREEAEAAAAAAAAKQAVMDALPDAFDELAEQTADNAMTIEVMCGAVEELAEMMASQNGGE